MMRWVMLSCALLAWPGAATAAKSRKAAGEKLFSKNLPVDIESDRASFFNKKNKGRFVGNVVAKQGDITVECEELLASYKKGLKRQISSLVATRNVRVHKGDRRAFGDRLDYDRDKGVLILTGNPRLVEGDSVMHGERVIFFVDEDRVEVERARGRMKVKGQ